MDWSLQDAENRFSEVVQRARREGPQIVTLRGKRAAVVLSATDYDALLASRPSLVDDLPPSPRRSAPARSRPAATSPFRCIWSTPTSSPRHAGAARSGRLAALCRSAQRPSQRRHPWRVMRGITLKQNSDRQTAARLTDLLQLQGVAGNRGKFPGKVFSLGRG